ncbi:FHA domain-containing protein [candidate division KSB1 bacterium]|nr:FHA domain-containing protein [candidate division KSB1 bacterium]
MWKLLIKRHDEIIQELDLAITKFPISIGSASDNNIVVKGPKIKQHHIAIDEIDGKMYAYAIGNDIEVDLNNKPMDLLQKITENDTLKFGTIELQIKKLPLESFIDDEVQEPVADIDQTTEIDAYVEKTKLIDDRTQIIDHNLPAQQSESTHRQSPTDDRTQFIAPDEGDHHNRDSTQFIDNSGINFPPAEYQSDPNDLPHYLIAIYGPHIGTKYRLKMGDTKIGRDANLNDIVINKTIKGQKDSSISRRHATIHFHQGQYFVSDKRSHTRTYVNKQKLDEQDIVALSPNDEIEIVSDKKSSIFRFVRDGEFDVRPPRKAGLWWIRNQTQYAAILSAIIGIICLIVIYSSFTRSRVITNVPDQLNVTASTWLSAELPISRSLVSNPALDDIDGDGVPEFIYLDADGHLNALNCISKQPIWAKIENVQAIDKTSIILADINANGLNDIIMAARNSRIHIFDGQNGLLIDRSDFLSGQFVGSPAVGDFNNDGMADFAICTETGKLYVGYSRDNRIDWESYTSDDNTQSTPTIIEDNILFGTENGKVNIFNISRQTFSSINVNEALNAAKGKWTEDNTIRSTISYGTIAPSRHIMIVPTREYNIIAFEELTNRWLWFDTFEAPIAQFPDVIPSAVFNNVDQKGAPNVIFGSHNGVIKGYNGSQPGQNPGIWEYGRLFDDQFLSNPALADIDKDGIADVIIGGASGKLYIINGSTAANMFTSEAAQQFSTTPLIGDIDNDHHLDILCMANDFSVMRYSTNASILPGTIVWNQRDNSSSHANVQIYKFPSASSDVILILIAIVLLILILLYHYYQHSKIKKLMQHI